jgi:TRAP-type C4-dicarboxylate transport system permease small subunit
MRALTRISDTILWLEQRAMIGLAAALLLLIVLNIVTRAAGAALFWVDELAIYTMIWMALIGASAMVRMRLGVAVTLVTELLPAPLQRALSRLVDAIVLVLALVLLTLAWQWYDPLGLARSGFDFDEFAANTFKFIYTEPTNTIGAPKFWIWLAVPLMAVDMTIHAAANLVEGRPETDGSDGSAGDAARAKSREPLA